MQEYRERLHRLQAQDADVNNTRIRLEYLRFFCTMVSSNYVMWKNLRYDDLKRFANVPGNATPAWLGATYHESPRSLSVDAVAWSQWKTPVCPWTTWKASWNDGVIDHPPPTKCRKESMRHRWRDRLLSRQQSKPSNQEARVHVFVSAFRRAQPVKRARSSRTQKRPRPHQGGFVEHLDENPRYQAMIKSNSVLKRRRKGAVLTKKSKDAKKAEAVVKQKGVPDGSEGDKVDGTDRERRKRKITLMVARWALCLGSLPGRTRYRPNKAMAADEGANMELKE